MGILLHVQTCANSEIRSHYRVENKWTCWNRRLGYMPLVTIQQIINTCRELDDLQGIAMPRNYISANVRMGKLGKATKWDQPSANPSRAQRPMQIVHFVLLGPANNVQIRIQCNLVRELVAWLVSFGHGQYSKQLTIISFWYSEHSVSSRFENVSSWIFVWDKPDVRKCQPFGMLVVCSRRTTTGS